MKIDIVFLKDFSDKLAKFRPKKLERQQENICLHFKMIYATIFKTLYTKVGHAFKALHFNDFYFVRKEAVIYGKPQRKGAQPARLHQGAPH